MKTAIVIGATGLVGSNVVKQLVDHPDYEKVIVFSRRTPDIFHAKLSVHIVDFEKPEDWKHLVRGNVLFSCMGTTLRQAGSKEKQYRIDYHYQFNFARIARENNVDAMVLISSAGAKPDSSFFYMRMKGELERDLKQLGFPHLVFIKPGPLEGERQEKRLGESIGLAVNRFMNKLGLMKKFRPVHGSIVAKAALRAADILPQGFYAFQLEELFEL